MKKVIALLLALVMVFSVTACGSTKSDQSSESQSGSETVDQQDTTGDEVTNEAVEYYMQKADDVTVTDTQVSFTDDGSGERVTLDKNPKKVAILYGSLTALWYEAGGTVQFAVGGDSAVTLYEEQIGHDITGDEGVKVVATSSSGTGWDIEAILAEKPDLIITSVGMKGYSTISGPAEAVGIPVIGIDYDGVLDYLKWFKVFCNLNDQPELWDEIAEVTANGIADIVSKTPKDTEAPTAAILVISSDVLKAYTHDSVPGTTLVELGGINVVDKDSSATSASVEISLEDLYAMDPDMIFLSWYGEPGVMYDQLMDMVGDNPVWQSLRAVKEERFYLLDKSLFHNKANKNYDKAYLMMAQDLYPDVTF
jgi:iron complex transport system substrate-binding protein